MKTMELKNMGLVPVTDDELKSVSGGTSFAHDVGSSFRWLYKFVSNGSSVFGMQMANIDYQINK